MALIQFTSNYDDLSTDTGFQFDFKCDHCGNGYKSSFQPNVTGMAGGFLRAAGNIFGGVLGSAGNSAYEIQKAIGGPAHDAALKAAVEEGKRFFKQCHRCGKWVCPEVCWNAERGMCKGCAPDLAEELTATQAETAVEQMKQRVQQTDQVGDLNVTREARTDCPKCGAETHGAKFCPQCGAEVVHKVECAKCGAKIADGAKFCPECGTPAGPAKCPGCGAEHEPGAKFCPGCGQKLGA